MSWPDVRQQFHLPHDRILLANFLIGAVPERVRERMAFVRDGLAEDAYSFLAQHRRKLVSESRESAAKYLGVQGEDIAFVESTTAGLSMVLGGLKLSAGDEILVFNNGHYSMHSSLHFLKKFRNSPATVQKLDLYADSGKTGSEEILKRIAEGITKDTRIIVATWVSSSDGVMIPMKKIGAMIEGINQKRNDGEKISIIVDGAHGLGIAEDRVSELGCDAFISGCHKGLMGPAGTGIVWMKKSFCKKVSPLTPSFHDRHFDEWLADQDLTYPEAERYTPGGIHAYPHTLALGAAFDFHLDIGRKKISARIRSLAQALKTEIAGMNRVRLHTPVDEEVSAAFVCFKVDDLNTDELVDELAAKGIVASGTFYPNQCCRMSPFIYNTEQEIERTVKALKEIIR